MKQRFYLSLCFLCLPVLILDSRTALLGAKEGLALCLNALIPSLLPYFLLCGWITGLVSGRPMPFLRPLGRFCGIPEGAEFLLCTGALGGYPAGAQCIANTHRQGSLRKRDAERMLAFCSNAGPSFLFGIIAPQLDRPVLAWVLWGIHLLSAVLIARVNRDFADYRISPPVSGITLAQAMEKALRSMALVCGWVMIFRVLTAFLDRWFLWALPETVSVFLTGVLELSYGCSQLALLSCDGQRLCTAAFFIGLGGVCVTMQTASVAKELSLRVYIPGKIVHALLSSLLCAAVHPLLSCCPGSHIGFWHRAAGVCLVSVSAFFLKRMKNSSSIPGFHGV